MLGFKDLHFCPLCDKLCLPRAEIDKPKKENSLFCIVCEQYYHEECLGVTEQDNTAYVGPGCEQV